MKNQKGVTLIALVITIIVLLILAGVSIAMLTGDNGILTNASKAQAETDQKNAIEKINIALQAIKTEALSNSVKDTTFNPETEADDVAVLITSSVTGISDSEKTSSDEDAKYKIDTTTTGTITISYKNSATGTDVSGKIAFDGAKGTITQATQKTAP